MIISKKLYVGKTAEPAKEEIIKGIRKEVFQPGVYCVTLPEESGNILDIRMAVTLSADIFNKRKKKKVFKFKLGLPRKDEGPVIVGIALGKQEAIELASKIIEDVHNETDGFDMQSYFN